MRMRSWVTQYCWGDVRVWRGCIFLEVVISVESFVLCIVSQTVLVSNRSEYHYSLYVSLCNPKCTHLYFLSPLHNTAPTPAPSLRTNHRGFCPARFNPHPTIPPTPIPQTQHYHKTKTQIHTYARITNEKHLMQGLGPCNAA
jgi:hypothetical protein